MRRIMGLAIFGLTFLGACATQEPLPPAVQANQLFNVVSMRLDRFSKVKSWTGTVAPSGIEAVVEFDDAFGDRTKAAGSILFEIYDYRQGWPDPRGQRIVNPFSASLMTFDEQKAHWDRASGAYIFRLACDQLEWGRNYVLSATYEPPAGSEGVTRLFSQIVLLARQPREGSSESSTQSPAVSGAAASQP
jgi:hypothetical protein